MSQNSNYTKYLLIWEIFALIYFRVLCPLLFTNQTETFISRKWILGTSKTFIWRAYIFASMHFIKVNPKSRRLFHGGCIGWWICNWVVKGVSERGELMRQEPYALAFIVFGINRKKNKVKFDTVHQCSRNHLIFFIV